MKYAYEFMNYKKIEVHTYKGIPWLIDALH